MISGVEKSNKVDGKVSSSGHISHGLASSTGENKTNQNSRSAEVSTVSSERVHTAQQSEFSSETGQPYNGKRKVLDSVMTDHIKVLKTDSSSSKESGEVVQLSSVDSTDPIIPSQSSNESKVVFQDRESSVVTKSSDSIAASLKSSWHFNFDLNEGNVEGKGAISVVAKVGVPMGLPKKPLQFGGELGWRRTGSASAFRPTSFTFPERGKQNHSSSRGIIDLNIAATMDSEFPTDDEIKIPMNVDVVTSKPSERFLLDLNSRSENDENHHKPGGSGFDLNNNPCESRPHLTRNVAADNAVTTFGGNVESQSIFDTRRPPSYWVDLSSMQGGFGHVQPQPFLVATTTTTPTAEQLQMVVPSGLYIGKINNLSPTFYPPSVLPHLTNQHGAAAAIHQIPGGSVLAAFQGGPVHFIEGPQGLNRNHPHAYANMRPSFFPNGSIPLVENGSRGVGNPELLIPVRNGFFETREKTVEPVALPASQINNYRQMASWN